MTWVAVAVVGGSVIGAVGSNLAAGKQASADKQAAQTQADMFNTIVGQEQPFLQGGYSAETSLNNLLYGTPGQKDPGTGLSNGYLTQQFNPTMSDLENTPGYQFALSQGGKAVTSAQTPGSGALSGSALKSLMSFNQGLASEQYQNSFNNFQTQQNNIFSRLSSIAGLGQNAAGNLGNTGAQLGTGIAQAQAAAGAANANGIAGAANNIGSGLTLAALNSQNGGGGSFSGGGSVASGAEFDANNATDSIISGFGS